MKRAILAAAFAALVFPATAQAVELKVSDSLPVNNRNTTLSIIPWMEKITELTKGEITFAHFPAQQLGKGPDALAMTQSGIADVSYIVPAWTSDKLPLSGVGELPGLYKSACLGAAAAWELIKEGGILYEQEWSKQNVRPLFLMVQPPYVLFTREKKIGEASDLEGLRIRATGSAQTPFVASLGAVPVGVPGPEVHESIARGTLDGLVFPITGLYVFDVVEYVKYGYTNEIFGGSVNVVGINKDVWDGLSNDVKKIIDEVSQEAQTWHCKGLDEWAQEARDNIVREGVEISEVSETAAAEFEAKREAVYQTWAENFDERGLPGTEVLKAFKASAEKARSATE